MAESRGVEPHPISENLVFKASRRTIPAALLSIVWYPESDSNRHDSPFERDASYQIGLSGHYLVRGKGIEPLTKRWQRLILPLN